MQLFNCLNDLRYPDAEVRFFFFFSNHVISVISDSTGEPVSMESEIVRVVSCSTTEISEIKNPIFKVRISEAIYPQKWV